ncbi:transcriptional regulator, AraC family with amidase-like domain [Colwellia chukchiensis]|uniref:Transcriptional regulator, AraC family with amidase-like domain n=1 Tax=Colwellia chukchiensis TaxID=641665 RepID=A0A1H7LIH4_9GAMM|nr:helix-turn-helix domain-containing protein [Colwellia chukchiensis]SEK98711.1 transcriptional regulator, AraC family with amidase-like domain [Colwellia chukchiensis]
MAKLKAKKANTVNIALLLYDHMLATSVSLPVEMLRAGEAVALQENRDAPRLSIEMVAETIRPISTRALIRLMPDTDIAKAQRPDFIFIPSLWRNPRPIIAKQPQMLKWLSTMWQCGSTLIGGGTGVCLMAEAGILDHHSATTHWHYVEQFKRDYPQVDLKPDFFITQSERSYCAASLNALADIVVHIIFQVYGQNAARQVERNFSHEIRKPYEEQRYLEGAVDRHPDELISQIQFWLKTNVNSAMNLNEIAQQFGISQRSFTRRFKRATGINARLYWQQLKIESAKELLAASNLSIQEVAYQVGFQDQASFTRLFKQMLNLTPKDYRAMVRKKLFSNQ